MVFGRNDRVCPRAIGHAQTRAQVVGVGDAVEHQDQGLGRTGGFEVFQQLVERVHLFDGLHTGGHPLVAVATGELGDAQAVGFDQTNAGFFDAVNELAHARIAARGLEMNFDDGLRGHFQAHADGVKAEKHFG